ncbi:lipocalin family protein [Sphingobacterium suaedae]|mgnify:CR=1 FL=1|uniref:Lipocalin family protein n=1 Tax=Sphingobacterium suaedae TaxID=1686402 RepID=A0ABW5KG17_9SPHI
MLHVTQHIRWITVGLLLGGIQACTSVTVPADIQVVQPFDVKAYAGEWYEVARFDFDEEKHLREVTANYELKDDGKIQVINRGFDTVQQEWKEAVGKATFVDDTTAGALKVSFFGPFYSGYNVALLEGSYEYALVFGEDKDHMWILSRTPSIPEDIKVKFLEKARQTGYDLNRLIWTKHKP